MLTHQTKEEMMISTLFSEEMIDFAVGYISCVQIIRSLSIILYQESESKYALIILNEWWKGDTQKAFDEGQWFQIAHAILFLSGGGGGGDDEVWHYHLVNKFVGARRKDDDVHL